MKYRIVRAMIPVALLAAGCGAPEEAPPDDEIHLAPVEVLEVERAEAYPVEERFVGRVEARRRSRLAFELGGTVESVVFDEGDRVERGEELAAIDTARLEARRNELEAALEQARADRRLAESTHRRNERLAKTGAVSEQELENARERLEASRAEIARVEAQLESVAVDLEKSVLRAPFDGRLAHRGVDEGAVVSPNEVVFELLESSVLEVRASMARGAVAALSAGDEVAVVLPGGKERSLPVRRVLPQRDEQTRTVDVILGVPETVTSLRDGDLVTVTHSRRVNEPGFFLPRDALTESVRGLWACFVAVPAPEAGEEARRLERRNLEVLHAWANEVYVRGALESGDRVLASGLQKVAPDQRVRVVSVRRAEPRPELVSREREP